MSRVCIARPMKARSLGRQSACSTKVGSSRIALSRSADLAGEPQPRLGVARLVLHHRRVVELRLVIGRDVEELGGHLAGELVRLELLRDHGTPQVAPASDLLRRALRLRDRRDLAPGQVANLPLGALGQLVEAEDARVCGWILVLLLDYLLRRPPGTLSGFPDRDAGTGVTSR